MNPEDALREARERAARRRGEGGYAESTEDLSASIVEGQPDRELLAEWAVIEIDPDVAYSTRRAGAPITFVKRMLLRLLRQYIVELEARQTRFNIALLSRLDALEDRVERAERDK
jgi:hypothetical protein